MENQLPKVNSWITEVFRNKVDEILDIEYPDYDTKGGFAGEIIFANLIGLKKGTKQSYALVIKKNKEDDIIMDTMNLRAVYLNEVKLYSEILPYLEKFARAHHSTPFENITHCHGTIVKDNLYLLILENLKPKGFRTHEIETHQDLSHAKLIFEAYAKWHALSLALKKKEPEMFSKFKAENYFISKESKLFDLKIKTVQQQLDETIKLYNDKNKPHIVQKLKLLKDIYKEHVTSYIQNEDEDYLVLKHGDSWSNNFLFHYNEHDETPDKVIIIDWQMSAYGSPITDLVMYMFCCCSRAEFERLEELLRYYHQCLSNKLKELGCDSEECFPWEVCPKSFKRYAIIGMGTLPFVAKMSQRNKDDTYDIAEAAKDGNLGGMYKNVRIGNDYFERVDGIFEFCIQEGYI